MRSARAAVLAFLAVFATGCLRTRPKPPIPQGSYFKQMSADLSAPDLLTKYNSMPEANDDDKAKKALSWFVRVVELETTVVI